MPGPYDENDPYKSTLDTFGDAYNSVRDTVGGAYNSARDVIAGTLASRPGAPNDYASQPYPTENLGAQFMSKFSGPGVTAQGSVPPVGAGGSIVPMQPQQLGMLGAMPLQGMGQQPAGMNQKRQRPMY